MRGSPPSWPTSSGASNAQSMKIQIRAPRNLSRSLISQLSTSTYSVARSWWDTYIWAQRNLYLFWSQSSSSWPVKEEPTGALTCVKRPRIERKVDIKVNGKLTRENTPMYWVGRCERSEKTQGWASSDRTERWNKFDSLCTKEVSDLEQRSSDVGRTWREDRS